MVHDPASPAELDRLDALIDGWVSAELSTQPVFIDVTRDPDLAHRWYIRLRGEARDVTAIWLTLRQRTLAYETYVLPAPVMNHEEMYAWLLARNYGLVGAQFSIGPEEAVFLTGELATHAVDADELDRIVGSLYEYVERFFPTALRLGFGVARPPGQE